MTIKTLVHGLVLAVAVPLIAVIGYLIVALYTEERGEALDLAATLAGYAADQMDQVVSGSEAILATVAARPTVRALDPESCETSLGILRDADPARANVAVIDATGRMICSVLGIPGGMLNVSDTEWFERVMAENRFVVSRLREARIIRRLVVVLAYPVRNDAGAPIGIVILPHELAKLRPLPDLAHQPEQTSVTILDRAGNIIARQPQTDWVGRNIAEHGIVQTALAGGSGASVGTTADGMDVVFAYRPIAVADWIAVATLPTAVVFAGARADTTRTTAAVGMLLVVVLSFAALAIRRILDPIEQIVATTRAVVAGDLDARMSIPPQEEFAAVARQFNAMLEVRHRSERIFHDLLESASDGVLLVDSQGAIRFANSQIEKMFGYARSDLLGQSIELLVPERHRAYHVGLRTSYEGTPVPRAMGSRLDLWARRRDGSEFAVDIGLSPMTMPDGRMICCAIRDITERQRAERRIQELNQMYSALSRMGHAITHIVDRRQLLDEVCRIAVEHGQLALAWIGFVDPRAQEIVPEAKFGSALDYLSGMRISIDPSIPTGQGPTARAIREGHPVIASDLASEANFEPWRALALAHGLGSSAAFPLLTDAGEPWGAINLYSHEPGYFDDPEIAQLLGVMANDLSFALDGLRRDLALTEAEERFRQIAENSRDVFWLTDPAKGQMLYISPGYEGIWGRTTAELYASPAAWIDAIHPDDRGRVREAAHTRQVSGKYDEEYRIVRPDGDVRWIHDRAFPVHDPAGAVYRIAGVAEDITERKAAEETLMRSEARLVAAQAIAHLGSWEYDLLTKTRAWSPEMYRLFGHDLALPPPSSEEFVEWLNPADREASRAALEGIVNTGESAIFEMRSNPMRGPARHFSVSVTPRKDANGRVVGLSGTTLDITRIKEAEAKLFHAQKMEALGNFAGGIAHDFNNMLTPIRALTELTKADLPADSPVQEYLSAVLEAAMRATDLVKQILAFSRQDVSQHTFLDLSRCVADALELLGNVLPSTIDLVSEVEPDVGSVLGDAAQVHSVILNLVANAAHAMNGKVGRLAVRLSRTAVCEELSLRHEALAEGKVYARLAISDTGHGMDPATLKRIFEPFFTTKAVGEGTGLGLAMVHGIILGMEGAIEVASEIGVGTTFEIFLPLHQPKNGAQRVAVEPESDDAVSRHATS